MGSSRGGGGGIERVLSMKCSDTKYLHSILRRRFPGCSRVECWSLVSAIQTVISPPARRVDVNISPPASVGRRRGETRQKVVIVPLSAALFPPDPTTRSTTAVLLLLLVL